MIFFNKNLGNSQRYTAFTLAEVLITLGIIGVVAAFTIPALIADNQKTENIARLKKFYSLFNQGLQQMASDYGCPGDLRCTGIFDQGNSDYRADSVIVMKILSSYIKTERICGVASSGAPQGQSETGCFGFNLSNRSYRLLNGDLTNGTTFFEGNRTDDRIWGTLSDGTFYGLLNNYGVNTPTHCINDYCAFLYVDVNGAKAPNQLGRDVFYFVVNNKAILVPARQQNTLCDGTDNCNTGAAGYSCSCKLFKENWVMNY